MSKAVLHQREHVPVFAPFREDQTLGAEADLLESRCVEVEPAHHPENPGVRHRCHASGDARNEQGRRSLIAERWSGRSDLVQGGTIQAAVRKPIVQFGDLKGQGSRLS